jgi:hypothetical protein
MLTNTMCPLQKCIHEMIATVDLGWTEDRLAELEWRILKQLTSAGYEVTANEIHPSDWHVHFTLTKHAFEIAGKANPVAVGF